MDTRVILPERLLTLRNAAQHAGTSKAALRRQLTRAGCPVGRRGENAAVEYARLSDLRRLYPTRFWDGALSAVRPAAAEAAG